MGYYIVNGTSYSSVLWDGKSAWAPPSGWTVMSEADFNTWFASQSFVSPVPDAVGPAQLRIAARKLNGITGDQIQAVISAISDADSRQDAQDLWDHAAEIRRNHPFTLQFGLALSLTSDQVDSIFRLAATL